MKSFAPLASVVNCIFALLFCVGATAQQTAPSGEVQANQKKARAAIDQMIQALGGQAYLNLQDLKSEVRYGTFYHGAVNGTNIYFRSWQWPDKDRLELTKQRDIVVLHVGDKGYEKTFRGTKFEDPEVLRKYLLRRDHSLPVILRQWINDPGAALFDDGPTIAENRPAEKVTIINSKNESVTILIAADTHLPIKKVFYVRDPLYKDRDEEVEVFDNWKVVQGVSTPYNTLVTHNGEMVSQQYILSISYNNQLESSLFDPGPINFDIKKK